MELLVTMIISSIVLSIASLAYEIIYKQYYTYRKSNDKIIESLTLKTILNNDFILSEKIIKSSKGFIVMDKTGKNVNYILSSGNIIREVSQVMDTFFLSVQHPQFKFQRQQQDENKCIDEFYFESTVLNEKEQFHFFKLYGSNIIMQAEKEKY